MDDETLHTLRIHHLDTGTGGGDVTILAIWEETRDGTPQNPFTIIPQKPVFAMLIDGGQLGKGVAAVERGWQQYQLAPNAKCADYVVTTCYDAAHASGIRALLEKANHGNPASAVVDSGTLFLDCGQPGTTSGSPKTLFQIDDTTTVACLGKNYANQSSLFQSYRRQLFGRAVALELEKTPTAFWNSAEVARATSGTGWEGPQQFVGKDLLPLFVTNHPSKVKPMRLTVIAANGWVISSAGNPVPTAVDVTSPETGNSLAFLLEFGSFRYYFGGNITRHQEGSAQDQPDGLLAYFQHSTPVGVAKLAQAGGAGASDLAFISQIHPTAVIATCGTGNPTAPRPDLHSTVVQIPRYYTGKPRAGYALDDYDVVAGFNPEGLAISPTPGDITVTVQSEQALETDGKQHFTVGYWRASTTTSTTLRPLPVSDTFNPLPV